MAFLGPPLSVLAGRRAILRGNSRCPLFRNPCAEQCDKLRFIAAAHRSGHVVKSRRSMICFQIMLRPSSRSAYQRFQPHPGRPQVDQPQEGPLDQPQPGLDQAKDERGPAKA
jgi:hypothetical protein